MSATVTKFTPLSGAKTTDPLCYLLQIDDCRILLDCGWDDTFDEDMLEPLERVAESVDFVLLSHSDLAHLGALPIAYKKYGLKAPIYATIPIYTMGQMFLYDAHQARAAVEDFDAFTLDDIDEVFATFKQLKYSQHLRLPGKGKGIVATPYSSGRSLGGTVWKLSKEAEDIVYAVDYNHKIERHLNPTVLETLTRPSLLITDAANALVTHKPRRERDKALIEAIMRTVKGRGNVLMPIDTAARALELLLLLEQHWSYYQLAANYSLVFFNNVAFNVIEFAKSQLEWLSDDIARRFEATRQNAFEFKSVRIVHSMAELARLPTPLVVLCSQPTLNCGPAKQLFLQWAADPKNLLLFTQRPADMSLAYDVMNADTPCTLDVPISRRVALEGQELIDHQMRKRLEQEQARAAAAAAAMEADEESGGDDDDPFDDVDDMDRDDFDDKKRALAAPLPTKSALDVARSLFANSREVRGAQFYEQGVAVPVFPPPSPPPPRDDFGDVIDLESWRARAAENDNVADGGRLIKTEVKTESVVEMQALTTEQSNSIDDRPTKTVYEEISIQMRMRTQYIDFEGRSDGKSIRTILSHVEPRKLILIHGTVEALESLATHCTTKLAKTCRAVLTPDILESVEVTSETNIYRIRLGDELLSSLSFESVGQYALTHVDGLVRGGELGADLTLDVLPRERVNEHRAVFVGDARLVELKRILSDAGFDAMLKNGVLVCNNKVMVRKVIDDHSGEPTLRIDGSLCAEYFSIRELLYSQFSIV